MKILTKAVGGGGQAVSVLLYCKFKLPANLKHKHFDAVKHFHLSVQNLFSFTSKLQRLRISSTDRLGVGREG